jgi:acyl-CoA thioesterase-1
MDLPPNYGGAYRRRFTAVYRDLAAAEEVALVPFLLEGVALAPGLMQADGVHPTAAAQPRLLETVWSGLRPLLASPASPR